VPSENAFQQLIFPLHSTSTVAAANLAQQNARPSQTLPRRRGNRRTLVSTELLPQRLRPANANATRARSRLPLRQSLPARAPAAPAASSTTQLESDPNR